MNNFSEKNLQNDSDRIHNILSDIEKGGIEDVEQYVTDLRNREMESSLGLLARLKKVQPGLFSWFWKILIIICWYMRPMLFVIGRTTRSYFLFLFGVLAVSWGVLLESCYGSTWRRTVKYEFQRTLGLAVGGGFFSTFFTATLAGLAVVSQAIYWLGAAGLTKMTSSILITILVREVAPILVGMILLGRNGILTVAECSLLALGGQLKTFSAVGIDPFILIVVPRVWALTISSFTLGMVFGTVSLFMGYVVTYAMGTMHDSIWVFYSDILSAMSVWDYVFVPLKFLVMGFMIGVGSCVTGMNIKTSDESEILLPKGFTRGIMLVMIVNILFTLGF